MTKSAKWIAIVAVVVLGFGGCATISNQTKQRVAITTSNGQVVVATINGTKVNLPGEVKISRAKGAVVEVRGQDNSCYESTQLVIAGKNKMSGWFWGNILWGGTTGSTTDAITGGMWSYSNPNFIVPVEKKANCKS